MSAKPRISVAPGDGIGPEIMDAVLHIMDKAGAQLDYDYVNIGESEFLAGNTSGISPESWDKIRANDILLKAPITTPQGGGYKSLNVTLRKSLGLFANVRPCKSYAPYIPTKHPMMDVVIIRENEEDLYAGIEHRQTADVFQCLKLITIPGTEKIVRYAFEYAKAYNRKKVTCMVKDNIMKVTDGAFSRIFRTIAKDYPEIESEIKIIDIGAALLADHPENFDVVVSLNLYGDIISDIAAQITGSVGVGGSANIGKGFAMFEAVHGSAPDIAGKNMANPTGLLDAAHMMLYQLGQIESAKKISNAWRCVIEQGLHTADIYDSNNSKEKLGTAEFANAVVENLGNEPIQFRIANGTASHHHIQIPDYQRSEVKKDLVGVDIFLDDAHTSPDTLGQRLEAACDDNFRLKMITNRGVKVYPDGLPETFCTDHWRCRFVHKQSGNDVKKLKEVNKSDLYAFLSHLSAEGFDIIKTENLYFFDNQPSFSLGQGE